MDKADSCRSCDMASLELQVHGSQRIDENATRLSLHCSCTALHDPEAWTIQEKHPRAHKTPGRFDNLTLADS